MEDFTKLPGFKEAIAGLEKRGRLTGWVTEIVDKENPDALFLKKGKPWYKSECPCFEGYWLDGGIGSVQCSVHEGLIPGLMWQNTCRVSFEKCPYLKAARAAAEVKP